MSEEYKRWETRYSAPGYIFGKAPNYYLAKCKALLPTSGRVLAVADGEGRNSVWLAEQGLAVHAIDFSPAAQDNARALARERGVNLIFCPQLGICRRRLRRRMGYRHAVFGAC